MAIYQTYFDNRQNKIILSDEAEELLKEAGASLQNRKPMWGKMMIGYFLNLNV